MKTSSMPIRTESTKRKVFIVDNHPLVREHLGALIEREADLEMCGEAADATTALAAIDQREPDIVILDISSKRSWGLDLLKSLKVLHPGLRVLALSLYDNRLYAERALQAGATGYLTKPEATVDILPAIRSVLDGQVFVNHRTAPQHPWDQYADHTTAVNHE
jgi:DNA-binding NarL/FixJ family response regulator